MRGRIAIFPLLLAGISAAPAASAQGGGNTVPRELVQALMFPFVIRGQPEPAIFVGRLPSGIPAELVPPGARAVGGVGNASGGQAVLVVAQPPAEAIAAYRARLEQAGWRPGTDPSMQVRAGIPAFALCGPGSTFLAAAATARAGGGSELRVITGTLDGAASWSPCSGERRPLPTDVPFPELTLPGGLPFGGGGGAADYHDANVRVEVSTPPAEIAAHLLGGLRQAGWTVGEPRTDEGAATGWAHLRGADGREWNGLVSVIPVSTGERDVKVRVVSATTTPMHAAFELDPLPRATGAPVPVELAATLLARDYDERPVFVSGRLPRELEGAPVPAGARVVGGMTIHEQATGLIFVPRGDATDALARYADVLLHAGWIANARTGQTFIGYPRAAYPTEFCTPGGRSITASVVPLRGGDGYVKLESHSAAGFCTREWVNAFAEIPLPPLTLPDGARLRAGGGGGGSDYDWDVSARLDTRLAPAALVGYYAGLLRQAGWTVRPTAGDETGATASAELRDAKGVAWHALIAASALDASERDVMVRVVRLQPWREVVR